MTTGKMTIAYMTTGYMTIGYMTTGYMTIGYMTTGYMTTKPLVYFPFLLVRSVREKMAAKVSDLATRFRPEISCSDSVPFTLKLPCRYTVL
jgi:hypothetical protein